MSTVPSGCGRLEGELVELALGTLSGTQRATVLAHVQGCARCREEVERLSSVADAVLATAPEAEPPPGFELRLFERMGLSRPRHRWAPRRRAARVTLALGVVAGALGAGLGAGLSAASGGPAALAAPIAADLTAQHSIRGEVYLAAGSPGWLFMSVQGVGVTGLVTCKVRSTDGKTATVGNFWIQGGAGSWAYELPVPAAQVRSAWIASGGVVLASAKLNG